MMYYIDKLITDKALIGRVEPYVRRNNGEKREARGAPHCDFWGSVFSLSSDKEGEIFIAEYSLTVLGRNKK